MSIQIIAYEKYATFSERNQALDGKQLSLFPEGNQELFPLPLKCQKPQISSVSGVSGVSPKVRNRYRVVLGDAILGDKLSLDEALQVARRGAK